MDDRCQVLEIDLMHDARAGWDDTEVLEGVLSPPEQRVPFAVPLELALHVFPVRLRRTEEVDLDRVVDDQIGRYDRIDPVRVTAQSLESIPHGGQVDDSRDTRKVLKDHAGRHERQVGPCVRRAPSRYSPHIILRHVSAAGVAQRVLQQNAYGEGKAVELD